MKMCRYCNKRPATHGRSLCFRCYPKAEIRNLYPPDRKGRPPAKNSTGGREPTEEELDAMIAEQSRDLPLWWYEEQRRGE